MLDNYNADQAGQFPPYWNPDGSHVWTITGGVVTSFLEQAGNQEEAPTLDPALVFGTEDRPGCHSSAGVAKTGGKSPAYGGQRTGDVSRWFKTKAK